jgi:glycosyltransferase involved in cell wall biosynthesis
LRIAILDYKVQPTNPAGGCHWRMMRSLSSEHEFTVFSVDFDNPDPARIRWVRVPAPRRPLALLFVIYHLIAPLYFRRFCRRSGIRFDVVQMVESNFSFGNISYAHFCHRYYLRRFGAVSQPRNARAFFRWLDHRLHAFGERMIYRRVRRLIVPSIGLLAEIEREYPCTVGRIGVIHNPIESERFEPVPDFDREGFRNSLSLRSDDFVLIFAALGHFERKGLSSLLLAISTMDEPRLKLVVVGGTNGALSKYRALASRIGLGTQTRFVGLKDDVRPYLWAGDAFVLPSAYETFSLATYEAAAAGLPLIVASTNGIEDIFRDGENGILIGTHQDAIAKGLRSFIALDLEQRRSMGESAKQTVRNYSIDSFVQSWREVYESQLPGLR